MVYDRLRFSEKVLVFISDFFIEPDLHPRDTKSCLDPGIRERVLYPLADIEPIFHWLAFGLALGSPGVCVESPGVCVRFPRVRSPVVCVLVEYRCKGKGVGEVRLPYFWPNLSM